MNTSSAQMLCLQDLRAHKREEQTYAGVGKSKGPPADSGVQGPIRDCIRCPGAFSAHCPARPHPVLSGETVEPNTKACYEMSWPNSHGADAERLPWYNVIGAV